MEPIQLFAAIGFPLFALVLGFYLVSEIRRNREAEAGSQQRREEQNRY